MATPDYVLTEEFKVYVSHGDPAILAAGTFVRPIETRYVPKHVTEKHRIHAPTQVYCYTRLGIIPIDKRIIRRTTHG